LTLGACRDGHPPCCWWREPCPRKSLPTMLTGQRAPACPGRAGGCGVRSASWP
jgi:hypothetical protein